MTFWLGFLFGIACMPFVVVLFAMWVSKDDDAGR